MLEAIEAPSDREIAVTVVSQPKTMAQSFLANAATRLHPIAWATGTAAGAAAPHMGRWGRERRAVKLSV